MSKKIIDISAWQISMDFKAVKASGVDAVIIRAGFGNNNVDDTFKPFITGAINAGLPVGIYWFSYAYTKEMAEREAEFCLKAIEPYKITLPVFFDWEYDSEKYFKKMLHRDPTMQEVTDMYSAFMGKILTRGYKAGYYTNFDYLSRLLDEKQIDGYYKWIAWYELTPPRVYCDIWQYAEEYISGCSVKVDMNQLNNESLLIGKDDGEREEEEMKFTDLEIVKKGSKGDAVRIVQAAVDTAVDGIAGPNTDSAIRSFQKKNKLQPDGIVGPQTWQAIWKTAQ